MPVAIKIKLTQPVTIAARAVASNEIRTQPCIPATTLRGAVFSELRVLGRPDLKELAEKWLGSTGPRWSAAWPAGSIPMPLCFYETKRQSAGEEPAYFNSLSGDTVPVGFKRVRKPFLILAANQMPAGFFHPNTRTDMHVHLDDESWTVKDSALFSRETLLDDQDYWAILDKEPPEKNLVANIVIGRRKSVGGDAEVGCWSPYAFVETPIPEYPSDAFVQLLTDAIVPDDAGSYLRGLDCTAWKSLTSLDGITMVAVESEFAQVTGWSSKWGLPRGAMTCIRAGSAWRFRAKDPVALGRALTRFRDEGLGIRRHEGFGWVCVNPPWLTQTLGAARLIPKTVDHHPPALQPVMAWPGFEATDRTELRKVLIAAGETHLDWKQHESPLRDLLGVIQRTGSIARGIAFLKQRQDAKKRADGKESAWDDVSKRVRRELERLEQDADARHAAFFLQAIIIVLQPLPKAETAPQPESGS